MIKVATYIIKWTINEYRQDKRTGPINPIHRSSYLKWLFEQEELRLGGECGGRNAARVIK